MKTKKANKQKKGACTTCGHCADCCKQTVIVLPPACPGPHYLQPVVIPDWTWRPYKYIGPWYGQSYTIMYGGTTATAEYALNV
jgi:polyferredoxin